MPDTRKTVTVVHYYVTEAVYINDDLVVYGEHQTSPRVLRALGFEPAQLDVAFDDMPGYREKGLMEPYRPPASLKVITDHLAKLKEERRLKRIGDLKDELARLESAK